MTSRGFNVSGNSATALGEHAFQGPGTNEMYHWRLAAG